jgi:hypothetical protein
VKTIGEIDEALHFPTRASRCGHEKGARQLSLKDNGPAPK